MTEVRSQLASEPIGILHLTLTPSTPLRAGLSSKERGSGGNHGDISERL
jgi:hypothetical protein